MSNNSAPAAPNYQPIADAQMASAAQSNNIAQQQLDWAKQTYADNKGTTDKVVDDFLKTQDTSNANAATDRARYQDKYQPLEDSLISDSQSYNSPARRDLEAGRAGATVSQNFDAARANATRDLEGYGVSPDSTRFAALDTNARVQQGAAVAGAQNQSNMATDATARALRSEAINVGRGYPGQVAGETNTGLQAGSGAVNSNLATTASGASTMGTGTQWNGAASNSLAQWGNTLNQSYGNQMTQYNANTAANTSLMKGIGGIAGMAMFAADGGEIDGPVGGHVPASASPSGGKAIDDVPARVNVGEFIMPKSAVEWFGTKHFYNLITKADEDLAEAKQRTGAVPAPRAAQQRPQALQVS